MAIPLAPKIRRLFIVGAGLSKAVNSDMPLANELVQALIDNGLESAMVTGELETSLAYLAQIQPFDRVPESYQRMILLQQALQQMRNVWHRSNSVQPIRRSGSNGW